MRCVSVEEETLKGGRKKGEHTTASVSCSVGCVKRLESEGLVEGDRSDLLTDCACDLIILSTLSEESSSSLLDRGGVREGGGSAGSSSLCLFKVSKCS